MAVEKLHRCQAVHVETIGVRLSHPKHGQWDGDVEVFALDETEECQSCFVWGYFPNGRTRQEFISVPATSGIDTATKAVTAVLDWQRRTS